MLFLALACATPGVDLAGSQADDADPSDDTDAPARPADDPDDLDEDDLDDDGFDFDFDTGAWGNDHVEYDLQVHLTVDDGWEMWIDDLSAGSAEGWSHTNTFDTTVSLNRDGPHVVAVHGYDTHNVISGFVGKVTIDGTVRTTTGDGQWRMSTTPPPADWTDPFFDDSGWATPIPCEEGDVNYTWGGQPTDLLDEGAKWVWHGDCRALGQVWFRYSFTLP